MKNKLVVILCFLSIGILRSQIDTAKIARKINSLKTQKDHQKYWDEIKLRDQSQRGSKTSPENDEENLVSVSYYFNKFGYPIKNEIGTRPLLDIVWVHTASWKAKQHTFPFMLQGLKVKEIPEDRMRSYYLRGGYNKVIGDGQYGLTPLNKIYKELDLNLADKIDIPALLQILKEYHKFRIAPKTNIGTWIENDTTITTEANMNVYALKKKGHKMEMYKLEDGKIFYKYMDGSTNPVEIIGENNSLKKFKSADTKKSQYYEITKAGDLIITNYFGKRILYKKYVDKGK